MKKVNPLFPKIGYYLGSIVIFVSWLFNAALNIWRRFLRFIKVEHERQKQGYNVLKGGQKVETEKWFFHETASAHIDQNLSQQNLSGDA